MDTVVLILVFLIALAFLLKQSFWDIKGTAIFSLVAAAFIYLSYTYAIEQSKNQIETWLSNRSLMLDTSVLLTIEVALFLAYAFLEVHIANVKRTKKSMRASWFFLRYFPGLLIFPIMFFGLTQIIFSLPGTSFKTVALVSALSIVPIILVGRYLMIMLIPEKELRLEMFFLTSTFVAILGIIATVNGSTVTVANNDIDFIALGGTLALFALGALVGYIYSKRKKERIK